MLCQLCEKNPATIKIAHVIKQKKIEINLCHACAEAKGVDNPMVTLPQIFGNFISELLGDDLFSKAIEKTGEKCECCGSSWNSFEKTGMFGCDICYQTFEHNLNFTLRRIHGSNKHIGNRPKSQRRIIDATELERIRRNLQKAILDENFERAAELRDILKDARAEPEESQNDGILR